MDSIGLVPSSPARGRSRAGREPAAHRPDRSFRTPQVSASFSRCCSDQPGVKVCRGSPKSSAPPRR